MTHYILATDSWVVKTSKVTSHYQIIIFINVPTEKVFKERVASDRKWISLNINRVLPTSELPLAKRYLFHTSLYLVLFVLDQTFYSLLATGSLAGFRLPGAGTIVKRRVRFGVGKTVKPSRAYLIFSQSTAHLSLYLSKTYYLDHLDQSLLPCFVFFGANKNAIISFYCRQATNNIPEFG